MLEQDAFPVIHLYPARCAVGIIDCIHGNLGRQAQFVQCGITGRHYAAFVPLCNSLCDIIYAGVYDAEAELGINFRLTVDASCNPDYLSGQSDAFKCLVDGFAFSDTGKVTRKQYCTVLLSIYSN